MDRDETEEDLQRELTDSMNRQDAEEEEVASSEEEEEYEHEEDSYEEDSEEEDSDSTGDSTDWREYRKKRKDANRLVKKNEEVLEKIAKEAAEDRRQFREMMAMMVERQQLAPVADPYHDSREELEDLSPEDEEYRRYAQYQERLERERHQKTLQQRNANWKEAVTKEVSDYWDVVSDKNVENLKKRRPRLFARLDREAKNKNNDKVEIALEIYEAISEQLERSDSKKGSSNEIGEMFHGKKSKAPPSAVGQKPKTKPSRKLDDPDELAAEVLRCMR